MLSASERIEFPKWINRPTRLIGYESDEIYLASAALLGTFIISFLFHFPTPVIIMLVVIIPFLVWKVYKFFKEEQTKGALYYFLYERNIIKVKEDPDEFIDCSVLGQSIIPIGYEQFFSN